MDVAVGNHDGALSVPRIRSRGTSHVTLLLYRRVCLDAHVDFADKTRLYNNYHIMRTLSDWRILLSHCY